MSSVCRRLLTQLLSALEGSGVDRAGGDYVFLLWVRGCAIQTVPCNKDMQTLQKPTGFIRGRTPSLYVRVPVRASGFLACWASKEALVLAVPLEGTDLHLFEKLQLEEARVVPQTVYSIVTFSYVPVTLGKKNRRICPIIMVRNITQPMLGGLMSTEEM